MAKNDDLERWWKGLSSGERRARAGCNMIDPLLAGEYPGSGQLALSYILADR